MVPIDWYIRKYGKALGRKKYNAYQRDYRRKNSVKLRAYWRKRWRARQAACAKL
jgi:hypothetical protein